MICQGWDLSMVPDVYQHDSNAVSSHYESYVERAREMFESMWGLDHRGFEEQRQAWSFYQAMERLESQKLSEEN